MPRAYFCFVLLYIGYPTNIICFHLHLNRYLFKKALLEDAIANAEQAERKAKAAVASTETVTPATVIVQTDQPKRTIEEGGDDQ